MSSHPYWVEGVGLTMDTVDGVRMLRESERRERHGEAAPGLAFHPGVAPAAPQDVIETLISRLRLRTCAARRCHAQVRWYRFTVTLPMLESAYGFSA